MDDLINAIEAIKTMNQCSLSEQDVAILNGAILKLQMLKKKKGLTDKHLKKEVVEIVTLILPFFVNVPK